VSRNSRSSDDLDAALVFAPEVPLERAVAMLPLCGVGLQNALGTLAPPEVAVHLEWTGGLRVNGAKCGFMRIASSSQEPAEMPDWLVVGFTLPLLPKGDGAGGETPEETTLYAEGCADVSAPELLSAWARHTLNWTRRWEEEGNAPLHAEWQGLAHGIGEAVEIEGQHGTFLGVDENFGMLLRDDQDTRLIPLTDRLESL